MPRSFRWYEASSAAPPRTLCFSVPRSAEAGCRSSAAAVSRVCSAGAVVSTVSIPARTFADGAGTARPSPKASRSDSFCALVAGTTWEASTSVRPITL